MNKTLLFLTGLLMLILEAPRSPVVASCCSGSGSQSSDEGCPNTDGLLPTLMNELNGCAGDCGPAGIL
jgi:hypothetical protein